VSVCVCVCVCVCCCFFQVLKCSWWRDTRAEGLSGWPLGKRVSHSRSLEKGSMAAAANATWSRGDLHLQPDLAKGHGETRAPADDLRWNIFLHGSCYLNLDSAAMSKGIPFVFKGKSEVRCMSFYYRAKSILNDSLDQHMSGILNICTWRKYKFWCLLCTIIMALYVLARLLWLMTLHVPKHPRLSLSTSSVSTHAIMGSGVGERLLHQTPENILLSA